MNEWRLWGFFGCFWKFQKHPKNPHNLHYSPPPPPSLPPPPPKLIWSDNSMEAIQFSIISWNCEGLKWNIHSAVHFLHLHVPLIVFLNEPHTFSCDVTSTLKPLKSQCNVIYDSVLNSKDKNSEASVFFRNRSDVRILS